uniref:Small ribosomal subunit protein uS3c n=1 Tax=Porphyridium purpureum TaxID=35688 RepID=W0S1T7_PORPP|nr:chloroplast 30S ribosomal protein S3 [Porphyridium purpureum]ATJ02896.1 30S ribosomal protein S3 [Porphyridium purpureum]BAO23673.1 chloroplast 30S ribosomal protein S3 [Porphyridium purpureum]
MGQKVHPLGFRLGITQDHLSTWFADSNYPGLLKEDFVIRSYLEKNLKNSGIANISIYRKLDQIEVEINTARPGIIIGRFGQGINVLRNDIQKLLNFSKNIRINIIEIEEPDQEATLLASFLTEQLERRTAFKRAVRLTIQKAQKANVQGIKVQVSGRLNGAEIARSEWVREGRVPLQTLRAKIDYSYKTAQTIYGILGVKIWLFKGEVI